MAKILSRSTASRIANRFFSTSRAASPSPLPSNLISRRSSPTIRTRMDRSGGSYSPLKSGSNFSDRPPTEMRPLFPGCDYEHWLIVMDNPGGENANRQQMIDCYVQTLAKIVGSEEEAKRKIYNVSWERYFGFGCEIYEETSNKLEGNLILGYSLRRGFRWKSMAGWQRHLQLAIRQVGRRVKNNHISTANYSSTRNLESPFSQGLENVSKCYLQGLLRPTYSSRPLHHYLQQVGISTSRKLQADEEPVSSPLSSPALLGSGKEEEQKIIPKRKKVQAVLKAIKQSPKKVNLVAALVRGMRVEDALMQLQVTVKRASQTVYRVIHAARANASHNHGLDPDRLLIAEAFVGKGLFKKRISYHGKGKCGLMIRPECRLTVIVRETTPEEETEIARLKVHNFKKLSKRERRLVPHKLIETTPIWNRRGTKANHGSSELVPSR